MKTKWEEIITNCGVGKSFQNASLDEATKLPNELVNACRQWLENPSVKGN